jgi:hypothetical protein
MAQAGTYHFPDRNVAQWYKWRNRIGVWLKLYRTLFRKEVGHKLVQITVAHRSAAQPSTYILNLLYVSLIL